MLSLRFSSAAARLHRIAFARCTLCILSLFFHRILKLQFQVFSMRDREIGSLMFSTGGRFGISVLYFAVIVNFLSMLIENKYHVFRIYIVKGARSDAIFSIVKILVYF